MGLLDSILGLNSASNTEAAVGQGVSDVWDAQHGANQILHNTTNQALGSLRAGAGAATDAINSNYGSARDALTSYGAQAGNLLSKAVGDAVGTVQGSNAAYTPYVSAGGGASNMLSNALGLNGPQGNDAATTAFRADPGYAWQRDQATDATARKAASLGMAASGNTLDSIARLSSNLADQNYQQWLQNLSNVGSQGLTAANAVSGNNQAAGGYQYGGGSTGAGLLSNLGLNLGNLDTAQGNALAGIQSNLGSSLAGVETQGGQQRAQNIVNAGNTSANLGVLGGQAQDSADNTNAGIFSKLIGGVTGLPFGGTNLGTSGGFTVAPGANGAVSVMPAATGTSGGLLSGALGQVGNQIRSYL